MTDRDDLQKESINKINRVVFKKLNEKLDLKSLKETLVQNMANPETINEVDFDLAELQRQVDVLLEAKASAIAGGSRDAGASVDHILSLYNDAIARREASGFDASDDKLKYNSLKIAAEEVKSAENVQERDAAGNPISPSVPKDATFGSDDVSGSDDQGD